MRQGGLSFEAGKSGQPGFQGIMDWPVESVGQQARIDVAFKPIKESPPPQPTEDVLVGRLSQGGVVSHSMNHVP